VIVATDDHLRDPFRGGDAAVNVLDHRPPVEIGERFAREPCRGVSSGDDGDDAEGRNRIDSRTSRCRVHDE
jgi:hypothetical protein